MKQNKILPSPSHQLLNGLDRENDYIQLELEWVDSFMELVL